MLIITSSKFDAILKFSDMTFTILRLLFEGITCNTANILTILRIIF